MALLADTGVQNTAPSVVALPLSDETGVLIVEANQSTPTAQDTKHALEANGDPDSDFTPETESGTDTTDSDSDSDSATEQPPATAADDIIIPSDGDRPQGWSIGLYSHLKKLVKEAKGAASKPVVKFIKKHLRGTKLILVVGETGTGKSSLIRDLTGQDVVVGHTHDSGTKVYQVCPGLIEGEQYLFVDTRGFGAADLEDMDNFFDIMGCLDALGPFVTFAGVIFVYDGTETRLKTHDLTTIRWVKCFCGPEFYRYVTIVTSKWDVFGERDFKKKWDAFSGLIQDSRSEMAGILNPATSAQSRRYHGAAIYHHGIEAHPTRAAIRVLDMDECADERVKLVRAMIKNRYGTIPSVKPQVIREMDQGTMWYDTEAAKVLQNRPSTLRLSVRNDFVRVTIVKEEELRDLPRSKLKAAGSEKPQVPKRSATATLLLPAPPTAHPTQPELPWSSKSRRSWFQGVFEWLEIAKDAANFFREARFRAKVPGGTPASGTWANMAGRLRSWWTGAPKPETAAS